MLDNMSWETFFDRLCQALIAHLYGLTEEEFARILTLSGYNSDLATAPFEKKQKLAKDRNFLGHRINIGHQNGLALNSLKFKDISGSHSLAATGEKVAAGIGARARG
jgi:hypothetical protein